MLGEDGREDTLVVFFFADNLFACAFERYRLALSYACMRCQRIRVVSIGSKLVDKLSEWILLVDAKAP